MNIPDLVTCVKLQAFRTPTAIVWAAVGSEQHKNLMGDEYVIPLNIFLEEENEDL